MTSILIRAVSSEADWAAARLIRTRVFIEEQRCPPEEEWDAFDDRARHLIATIDGLPVATARWRAVVHDGRPAAKLERFAVLSEYRGRGWGQALVRYAMADALRAGFRTCVIHAQAHLEPFYTGFGFRAVTGERFMEAGIPHVEMVRRGDG